MQETLKNVTTAIGGILIFMGLSFTSTIQSLMREHYFITIIVGFLIIIYGADMVGRIKK